jgi:septin family protein
MAPPQEWPHRSHTCSFGEIVGYLERQYDDILAEESRIKRNPRFRDNRVHVLLYFITPTGHGYVSTPPMAECY